MSKRGVYSLGICAICLFITSVPLFAEEQVIPQQVLDLQQEVKACITQKDSVRPIEIGRMATAAGRTDTGWLVADRVGFHINRIDTSNRQGLVLAPAFLPALLEHPLRLNSTPRQCGNQRHDQ
jgi:hypothetical protein